MLMYDKTVTLFNFYESSSTGLWYPHVLSGVDLNTDRGAIIQKYGMESTDNAELHVSYINKNDSPTITDASGNTLPWLPPKEWAGLVNDELAGSITFAPGDLFMWGEWSGTDAVDDSDYTDRRDEGFAAWLERNYDYVYKVTAASGAYTVIPHFEIMGK